MKKIISLLLIACSCVAFSSCKGAISLGERAIVKMIYLDYKNFEYEAGLVVFTCEPDSDTGSVKEEAALFIGKGESIYKAISNAQLQQTKKPFYAQNEILILGEYAAQNKSAPIIDYFITQGDKGRDMSVFVYKNGLDDLQLRLKDMSFIVGETQRIIEGSISSIKSKKIYECSGNKNGAFLGYLPILTINNEKDCISNSIAFFNYKGEIDEYDGVHMQTVLMLDGRTKIIENQKELFSVTNIKKSYAYNINDSEPQLVVNISGIAKNLPGASVKANQAQEIATFAQQLVSDGFSNKTDYFGYTSRLNNFDAKLCEQLMRQNKFYTKERVKINIKINNS